MTTTSSTRPRETVQDVRDRVVDRLDELMEPRTIATRQWSHQPGVEHLVPIDVQVRMPGLLVQLAGRDPASTAGRSSNRPGSRPPGSLAAADALRMIDREARPLAAELLTDLASSAIEGLQVVVRPRRLVDAMRVIRRYAPELKGARLHLVDGQVRRWWAHARIVTTWDEAPLRPFVPCPACGRVGDLQLVRDPLAMACLDCGAAWDASSEADLAAAYRLASAEREERHAEQEQGSTDVEGGQG